MVEGLLARVEFRNDHSDVNFFDKDKSIGITMDIDDARAGMAGIEAAQA